MTTICLNAASDTYYFMPFPYDCRKYIKCTEDKHFAEVMSVNEGLVYNPANGQPVDPIVLACAVTKRKYIYVSTILFYKNAPTISVLFCF